MPSTKSNYALPTGYKLGEYVIENYQRTPAVPDALVIMARAYRIMGVDDLADDAIRVLRLNYPDNPDLALLDDPRGYKRDQEEPRWWKFW